jgi:hypothetical protein
MSLFHVIKWPFEQRTECPFYTAILETLSKPASIRKEYRKHYEKILLEYEDQDVAEYIKEIRRAGVHNQRINP